MQSLNCTLLLKMNKITVIICQERGVGGQTNSTITEYCGNVVGGELYQLLHLFVPLLLHKISLVYGLILLLVG